MKVVMLVNNNCVSDSRVIREAAALVAAGHEVHVIAHWSEGLLPHEVKDGVVYHRTPIRPADRLKARTSGHAFGVPQASPPRIRPLWALWSRAQQHHAPRPTGSSPREFQATRSEVHPVQRRLRKGIARLLPVHTARGFVKSTKQAAGVMAGNVKRVRAVTKAGSVHLAKKVLTPFSAMLVQHARIFPPLAIRLRPDVVHAHDLYTLLAGHRIAKATGARLVYDSHELETGRNGNFSDWERLLRARSEGWLIRRSDAVITVCDSIADHLSKLYSIPRPVVVLNAPSAEEQRRCLELAGARDVRAHIGLDEATPLAVYVGSVTINRGLEQCVQALAHAPALHIAAVGPRRAATEADLIRIANELGVRDRLHLVDPVPHHEVTAFVRTAGVSLITIQNVCLSYQYCFPNKLLESLLAGVPVVVGRLIELERMVELTKAGVVVDETDPKAIAKGVMRVLSERTRYAPDTDMIRWLLDNYSWDRQQERLSQLYERLRTEPRPQAV